MRTTKHTSTTKMCVSFVSVVVLLCVALLPAMTAEAQRGGWDSFEAQMLRVLPGARFVDLDASHPIFHSFFEIDDLDIVPQYYDAGKPIFRGIFEDNDPNKRLMAMVNFNTDISEYWEFSDTGLKPIDESNEAYKLGVNYIVYGMMH